MQRTCNTCYRSGDQATYYCTTSEKETQHPVCRQYFVSALKKEHVISISKKTGQDPGGLPYELYSATLDDNTEVVVKQAFHTSCHHNIPFKTNYTMTPIHVSYFNVVKNIFKEMNQTT